MDKRLRELVHEDELGFAVTQEYGDRTWVETEVDVVEDSTGHESSEVELVHGGDVGGEDGDHVVLLDAERLNGGCHAEASEVGLRPGVGGGVVDDRRAISMDGSGSFKEAKWC